MHISDHNDFMSAVRGWLQSKQVEVSHDAEAFTHHELTQIQGILAHRFGMAAQNVVDALHMPGLFPVEVLAEITGAEYTPPAAPDRGLIAQQEAAAKAAKEKAEAEQKAAEEQAAEDKRKADEAELAAAAEREAADKLAAEQAAASEQASKQAEESGESTEAPEEKASE